MAQDKLTIEQWINRAGESRKREASVSGPDYMLEHDLRGLTVAELVEISKALDSIDRALDTDVQVKKSNYKRLKSALHNAVDPAF